MPDYLDETHQRISEFADEYLDEDERESFVDSLMERRGYKRSAHWEAPEPDGGDGGRAPLVKNRARSQGSGQQQRQQPAQRSYFGGNRK